MRARQANWKLVSAGLRHARERERESEKKKKDSQRERGILESTKREREREEWLDVLFSLKTQEGDDGRGNKSEAIEELILDKNKD